MVTTTSATTSRGMMTMMIAETPAPQKWSRWGTRHHPNYSRPYLTYNNNNQVHPGTGVPTYLTYNNNLVHPGTGVPIIKISNRTHEIFSETHRETQ